MEEQEFNLLIIGLPEAGKTSYIHAVDDLLQSPVSDEALRSYGLASDRSYLERDKGKYRAGRKFEHTERNLQGPPPELLFEHPRTKRRGRLFLPDVSGEIFQDQWADRKWTESYRDSLENTEGILLFVRADTPASNQELLGELAIFPQDGTKPIAWDPKKASSQVQVVEVLQFIATKGDISRPLKAAVLISAWDTVDKPHNRQPKNPDDFLKREWPLLDQFLRSNRESYTTKIYGVSALGGSEEELRELNKFPPQERVKIVENGMESKDLTRPLRWLLNLD